MKKISIYVHIPFCIKKCAYCDFLSAPAEDAVKIRYIDALCHEIDFWQDKLKEYEIDTIFFGGGTPSCLQEGLLEKVLCKLNDTFTVAKQPEITIEVNPGTVDINKLKAYQNAGINRISIGLQSTIDEELKLLGRIHTYEDFLKTYENARKAGFYNINIDLMSALPKQTLGSYLTTLKRVLSLSPEHISAYSLIIEEGTPFYERYEHASQLLPDEDEERAMYEQTEIELSKYGYHRYEISNYAKEGYECRHNLTYWRRGEYLGIGLGSASLFQETRFSGIRELDDYFKVWENKNTECKPYSQIEKLTKKEQMEEFMFLGLRCMEGVLEEDFYQAFHVSLTEIYGSQLKRLLNEKLLCYLKQEGRYKLTKRGIDVSNYVFAMFI